MRNLIDLHCHILPGLDDGAKTLADSLQMAEAALDQEITHILCTPHHANGRYSNPKEKVIRATANLQKELDQRHLPLTLLEGQEIRIHGEIIQEIKQDQLLFTDLNDTYLLIELPTQDVPAYSQQLFFQLRTLGKVPVIVHPERNKVFMQDPNQLSPFLEMGCLAQLTAPSLVGIYGKTVQQVAQKMVQNNLVQMVASDAHGVDKRTFYLKEAYESMNGERALLMQKVAKEIVNGDPVHYLKYRGEKKRKFRLF